MTYADEISDIVLPSDDFALGGRWYRQGRPNSCSFIALVPVSRQYDPDDEPQPPLIKKDPYRRMSPPKLRKWVHPLRNTFAPIPPITPLPPKPDWIEGKLLDLVNDLRNPFVSGGYAYPLYECRLARQILSEIGDYENAFKALRLEFLEYERRKWRYDAS
jgi:hypothetical protein